MSMKEVGYFTYECDWDECELTADEDCEFSAWSDEMGARESLENSDYFYPIDGKWYCRKHWHWGEDGDEVAGPDPAVLVQGGDE
jgi:hypothetical protein